MRWSVLSLASCLTVFGCALESDALSETEPDVLAAVADIDVDRDDNPGACTPGLVWTSTSRRIEVRSYSFWQGSSGYRVERTALTAAQRTALNALCVRPQPTGPVFADISAFQIDVTDNNGSVKSYRSAIDDLLDGDENDHSIPTIEYDSLKPFLATFRCLHATETRATRPRAGETLEQAGPPWQFAPVLPSDPGCLNGMIGGTGCQESWVKVTISAKKRMNFFTEKCVGVTQIRLYDQSGTTQIAASTASSAPSCPSLSYSFNPGTYLLNLRKTNAGGSCMAVGTSKDYWLRSTAQ